MARVRSPLALPYASISADSAPPVNSPRISMMLAVGATGRTSNLSCGSGMVSLRRRSFRSRGSRLVAARGVEAQHQLDRVAALVAADPHLVHQVPDQEEAPAAGRLLPRQLGRQIGDGRLGDRRAPL